LVNYYYQPLRVLYFDSFFALVSFTCSVPTDAAAVKTEKIPLHPPAPCTPVCGTASLPAAAKLSPDQVSHLTNEQVVDYVAKDQIKDHQLEKYFGANRAVGIRRMVFEAKFASLDHANPKALDGLPSSPPGEVNNWYDRIHGANCEIVTGYIALPVGIVGPLTLNDETVYIPMATTEGCLVASTNRGCKAISMGGGATSSLLRDGITRAPCLQFTSAKRAAQAMQWVQKEENFRQLKQAFESTTSFGKLISATPTVGGRNLYLRLKCFSGDAMGMNMVSKGSLAVVDILKSVFDDMSLVALSGNMCTDKKAAATNWIDGRGKSVVVEAIIPNDVVRTTLKTTVEAMVRVNINKNLIGSAMAGAMGGFNAHASNIVTAVFLATGQDPAQNVESSNCITLMEETAEGDLWISCTMPSVEVGTVGGGTGLPAQAACLEVIGCKGGGKTPGANSQKLAHVVAAATMAGELSLLAALAANTLVQAHMQHNRKPAS
jgi:hydroxymethylglutaryl-CoA reductase (NADPH)